MIFEKLYKSEIDVLQLVKDALENRRSLNLTYLNQNCFNVYNSNINYRNLLDDLFTVFLDGIGMYSALRFLGYKEIQKFNASDLNEKLFKYFSIHNTRLFLTGGKFQNNFVNENMHQKKINVVGYQNGFFQEKEFEAIVNNIEKASPDVLVIGMGVPRQEFVAEQLIKSFDNTIIICVGNFLEFYFQTKKRIPKFFRNSGVEWIYRLLAEPRRLWRRYLIGIPVFLFNILKLRFTSD